MTLFEPMVPWGTSIADVAITRRFRRSRRMWRSSVVARFRIFHARPHYRIDGFGRSGRVA